MSLKACPDLLFLLDASGDWVASNPLARTHVAMSSTVMEALRRTAGPQGKDLGETLPGLGDLWAEDRTVFGCRNCLLDDATGLSHDPAPKSRVTGPEAVTAALKSRLIVIEDEAAYRRRFSLKTRLMDPERLGSFHQQMGYELLVRQRKNPEAWWVTQKFEDGLKAVKNTAYRKVQEEFLQREVPKWGLEGKKVLDAGCGVGYYSHFFATHGARVLGLDPNPDHIKDARATFQAPGLSYEVFDFADLESLKNLSGGPFDLIFLSDVLLFYFIPFQPPSPSKGAPQPGRPIASAADFLHALKGLLGRNGRIKVMDPHGSFSLCLRYGDPSKPLAALSEYKHKEYGIAPNLETVAHGFREAGLAVVDVWETAYEGPVRDREDAFLREFPTWWLFELAPLP